MKQIIYVTPPELDILVKKNGKEIEDFPPYDILSKEKFVTKKYSPFEMRVLI